MNRDKYIIVKNISDSNVITIVQDLANLYNDIEYTKGINIYKSNKETNSFYIDFSNTPDFERFNYFVNYLHYPEAKDINPELVRGYSTIGNEDGLPSNHLGDRVMLYVSSYDEEGDNVFTQFKSQDKPVKLGFASGHEYQNQDKKEFDFVELEVNDSDYRLLKSISPDMEAVKKSNKGCLGLFLVLALFLGLIALV